MPWRQRELADMWQEIFNDCHGFEAKRRRFLFADHLPVAYREPDQGDLAQVQVPMQGVQVAAAKVSSW